MIAAMVGAGIAAGFLFKVMVWGGVPYPWPGIIALVTYLIVLATLFKLIVMHKHDD